MRTLNWASSLYYFCFVFICIFYFQFCFAVVKAAGTYFPTEGTETRQSSPKITEIENTTKQPIPASFPSLFSALHFAQLTRNLALNLSLPHMSPLFGLSSQFQPFGSSVPLPCLIEQKNQVKVEDTPPGYRKFRFNENCQLMNCTYRNNQSHFHCIREDCNYSFCDKTRFVQHSAKHERLDSLMGVDFKQFRSNMQCNYESCIFFQNFGEFLHRKF